MLAGLSYECSPGSDPGIAQMRCILSASGGGVGAAAAGEAEVAASVLATIGHLATVAGPALRPHMGGLLPLIIDAVQDPSASVLRIKGVVTLSQVLARCVALCRSLHNDSSSVDNLLAGCFAMGPPVMNPPLLIWTTGHSFDSFGCI